MNKQHFIEHLKFALETKLQEAKQAANSARADAIHEQSAAETQYDSLSIESAYLAQGQSERVDDAYRAIKAFDEICSLNSTETITVGSLLCCKNDNEQCLWYFIGPAEGGLKLVVKNTPIWIITPFSPLGKLLLSKSLDEAFEWRINSELTEFLITKIL
ncbi:transcription elongation factor GreAB [Pseudoalteromonas phenolica]|uniref:Transcription elongation factor GreAB n=1 Tax=Pseudoalteromonas phenolica TaxID=161398 RepID=A0A4Q7IQH2_9GAMM|nr:transcription elongation factor GreAB [Pseudoalteromonas phenolica]RZQ54260.1 transcription elongation factor GreAB [Pseudoalteromonas phenolica]